MTATAVLHRALAVRYPWPRWALAREVPRAAGGQAWRVADAIAMALWPSDGFRREGFEIKTSRRDWRRELSDPSKATAFREVCHRWWLVIADPAIVRGDRGEVPDGWGILLLDSAGVLRIWRRAPALDPLPYSEQFAAAFAQALVARGPGAPPLLGDGPGPLPYGGSVADVGTAEGRDRGALAVVSGLEEIDAERGTGREADANENEAGAVRVAERVSATDVEPLRDVGGGE